MPPFATLVADANALLSAATGGVALRVFHLLSKGTVVTTEVNYAEMQGHLPDFLTRYGLDEELVSRHLALLPLTVFSENAYRDHIDEARSHLADDDPGDVAVLALALAKRAAIWSNDDDFDNAPIVVYPTAVLLKVLGT